MASIYAPNWTLEFVNSRVQRNYIPLLVSMVLFYYAWKVRSFLQEIVGELKNHRVFVTSVYRRIMLCAIVLPIEVLVCYVASHHEPENEVRVARRRYVFRR